MRANNPFHDAKLGDCIPLQSFLCVTNGCSHLTVACVEVYHIAKPFPTLQEKAWPVKLKCTDCGNEWIACRFCLIKPGSRSNIVFASGDTASEHGQNFHPDHKIAEPLPRHPPCPGSNMLTASTFDGIFQSKKEEGRGILSTSGYNFMEAREEHAGTRFILCQAFMGGMVPPGGAQASKDVLLFWALFSKMACTLSRKEAAELLLLVNMVRSIDKSYYLGNRTESLRLPADEGELRSSLYSGRHSLRENLPMPTVKKLGSQTLTLPSEVVRHFIARDIEDLQLLDSTTAGMLNPCHQTGAHSSRIQAPRSRAILKEYSTSLTGESTKLCTVSLWTDGFDCNTTKKDRDSVVATTMTFTLWRKAGDRYSHTVVLSLGWKGADQEEVLKPIAEDLAMLGDKGIQVYHQGSGSVFNLFVVPYVFLIDFAARGPTLGLASHSAHHAKVWGYGGNVYAIYKQMHSCKICLSLLLHGRGTKADCPTCISFDVSRGPSYKPPPDFPPEKMESTNPPTCLFERLTNSAIVDYCKEAMKNFEEGKWPKPSVIAFLKTKTVSPKTTSDIIRCAEAGRPWNPPAFLSLDTAPLDSVIDVFMHLVHLGLVKTTFKSHLVPFLKSRGANAAYDRFVKPVFDELVSLNLEWLKVLPWGEGTTGGLCSENFLALGRLSHWLGDAVSSVVQTPSRNFTDNLDTGKPKKWKLCDIEAWLRARDLWNASSKKRWLQSIGSSLDHRFMKKGDYINWIVSLCSSSEGPPPLSEFYCVPTALVTSLMASLGATVAQLMMKVVTEEACDNSFRETQLFLNVVSLMTTANAREEGKIVTGSLSLPPNFYSALNLSREVLRKFGTSRNLWEGGPQGEAAISDLRPHLSQKKKSTALETAHKNHHQAAILNHIVSKLSPKEKISKHVKNFHVYSSYDELDVTINTNKPLSGAVLKDGRLGFVLQTHPGVQFRKILLLGNCERSPVGTCYWNVGVDDSASNFLQSWVQMSCVLLPMLKDCASSVRSKYQILSSEWQTLVQNEREAVWCPPSCQALASFQATVMDASDRLNNLQPLRTMASVEQRNKDEQLPEETLV